MDNQIPGSQFPVNQTQMNQVEIAKYNLERQLKSSAGWFYWIAALSMINWIASVFKIGYSFVVGLGATQLVDGIAQAMIEDLGSDYATMLTVISFIATLAIAGVYALFGYFGNKRANWAFVIGIALYVLDAGLFVWVQDWMPLIFHGLALFYLFRGPGIIKKLRALEESQPVTIVSSQPF
jgi:hypothetical protein